jgi:cation-transporting ATPase 13A1
MLVNYKGRPHMMGAVENKTLLVSLASMVVGAFICAFEVSPWLNNWLQLVPMPDDAFRYKILGTLFVSVVGTIAWDQIMLLLFAPQILFAAYTDTLRALPRPRDLGKPLKKIAFGAAVAYLYFLHPATKDNGFVLVGAFYLSKIVLK